MQFIALRGLQPLDFSIIAVFVSRYGQAIQSLFPLALDNWNREVEGYLQLREGP